MVGSWLLGFIMLTLLAVYLRHVESINDTASSKPERVTRLISEETFKALRASPVFRLPWTPDQPFARHVATLAKPVVLTGTMASEWPALSWTAEALVGATKTLHKVYAREHVPPSSPFHVFATTPLSPTTKMDV